MKKKSSLFLEIPEESKNLCELPKIPTSTRISTRHITQPHQSIFKTFRSQIPRRLSQFPTSLTPDNHNLPELPSIPKSYFLSKPSQKAVSDLVNLITALPSKINFLGKVLNLPNAVENKKTLILDLDETLTHAVKSEETAQVCLKVNEENCVRINVRPFVQDLLKFVSEEFEVVVFTASQKKYADLILDFLDPERKFIHYRLYREHCYCFKGQFVKDIRILGGRDMRNVIIVDNMLTSFALQVENGILVNTWTGDRRDSQLKGLIEYLKVLKIARDVRTVNRNTFRIGNLINEEIMRRKNDNVNLVY